MGKVFRGFGAVKSEKAFSDLPAPVYFKNTLSSKKELFEPLDPELVKIYSCGPTVYKKQHIGNMRAFVFADTLHRVLKYNGYKLKHVINITDVGHLTDDADDGEDKIEKSAKESGKSAKEISEEITKLFLQDLKKLNLNLVEYDFPKATAYIAEQIEIIKQLEKRGYTYRTSDGIYFDTSKFKDYGALGNLDKEGLREGARIGKNSEKKNPTDFALWKFSKAGEKRQQEWDSPWGVGFPGWHIECSAMSRTLLGVQIDIHTGGVEHVTVHHNNEIAQSECSSGVSPFVKYWLHGQHLKVDGEKMSKSLGNVIYLSDIEEKGFLPEEFRYFLLGAHYRSEINFTWEALGAAKSAHEKILRHLTDSPKSQVNKKYKEKFLKAVNDDLNTPKALALFWKLLKDDSLSKDEKSATAFDFDKVLGLNLKKRLKLQKSESVPQEVLNLARERQKARQEKNWEFADSLRDKIKEKGFDVLDTKDGTKVLKSDFSETKYL